MLAATDIVPQHAQQADAAELGETTASTDETKSPVATLNLRNWLNVVAFVLNFAVTYLSLTGVFGETNSDLSKKYQTLVTPAGWAFSIWGPIFIWEGTFTVAQMFPRFRGSEVVLTVSPWWWAACACQVIWTIVFAQEIIPLSLVAMFGILAALLGVSWSSQGLKYSVSEFWLLRAPFSLHLGWIIVASAVNLNVQADAAKAAPEVLLGLAILVYCGVLVFSSLLALAAPSPDVIVPLVATWATLGIRSELGNPERLNDPTRFNPYEWDPVVLSGLRHAALGVALISSALAGTAMSHNARMCCK